MAKIPWFGPELGSSEFDLVNEVLRSNYVNDGPVTRRFEESVANFIGVKHCVGVTSGTAAITLALMGMGIGRGDEVIIPDLTFIATANAVTLTGAEVRLVDVRESRIDLDPEKVVKAITPKTRAIVPVDINGRGAWYDRLESICKERDLVLVSDSAEALGSKWRGRFLGSFGNAGCFSFSPNKTVTTGQGGMIATNDTGLYHRLLELKDQGRRQQGTGGNDLHPVLGFNFKLTNLQAALGLGQMELLEGRLEKAKLRDRWYFELLKNIDGIEMPDYSHEGEVRQWTDIYLDQRDKIEQALVEANIGCRSFWYPIHTQGPYKSSVVENETYKAALRVSQRGLWLPSHFNITEEQVEKTVETIKKAL